jgi:hypothetical protein
MKPIRLITLAVTAGIVAASGCSKPTQVPPQPAPKQNGNPHNDFRAAAWRRRGVRAQRRGTGVC